MHVHTVGIMYTSARLYRSSLVNTCVIMPTIDQLAGFLDHRLWLVAARSYVGAFFFCKRLRVWAQSVRVSVFDVMWYACVDGIIEI